MKMSHQWLIQQPWEPPGKVITAPTVSSNSNRLLCFIPLASPCWAPATPDMKIFFYPTWFQLLLPNILFISERERKNIDINCSTLEYNFLFNWQGLWLPSDIAFKVVFSWMTEISPPGKSSGKVVGHYKYFVLSVVVFFILFQFIYLVKIFQ